MGSKTKFVLLICIFTQLPAANTAHSAASQSADVGQSTEIDIIDKNWNYVEK